MDFSTSSYGKKKLSETNYAPVPPAFREALLKTGILFHVYYDNCTTALKPFNEAETPCTETRRFPYYCLLHLLSGDGFFYDAAHRKTEFFEQGTGLLISPGFEQQYGGRTKNFTEDSVCFTGPLADEMFRRGLLRNGLFYMGTERRILPIIRAIQRASLPALLEASALLVQLLLALDGERQRVDRPACRQHLSALLARLAETAEHEWSVDEMAEYLNISTNSLRKLFLSEQGMTPKHYLDQLWLRRATDLLCRTNRPLLEIAHLLHCADPYYFFRRFRKLSGISPARYRREFQRET